MTWLARVGVALSLPTLGAPLIGATSVLTLMGTFALSRTFGVEGVWPVAGIGSGLLVGLLTAVGVGRLAASWWSAAGRLRADTGSLLIGADGVRWSSGEEERFLSWADVERIDEEPTIEDELGTLVLVQRGEGGAEDEAIRFFVEDSDELAADAQRALDAYRAAAVERVPDLEPNGRDPVAWLADAKRLLASASYRAGAVSAERLIALASTAAAPAAQRIGAAVSLSRAPDELRTQVRVALTETADTDLRDVMEDALDGRELDVRALGRALAAR